MNLYREADRKKKKDRNTLIGNDDGQKAISSSSLLAILSAVIKTH